MSMMTNIVDVLKRAEIDGFLPGKHVGACKSAYVVVEDGGVIKTGKTTGRHVYLLTAMVPLETPSKMTTMLTGIGKAMAQEMPWMQMGDKSPDVIDEDQGAYCVTIEFSALCSAM